MPATETPTPMTAWAHSGAPAAAAMAAEPAPTAMSPKVRSTVKISTPTATRAAIIHSSAGDMPTSVNHCSPIIADRTCQCWPMSNRNPGAFWVYLAVAAIGLVGTAWFNVRSVLEPSGETFFAAWFANPSVSSLAWDLLAVGQRRVDLHRPRGTPARDPLVLALRGGLVRHRGRLHLPAVPRRPRAAPRPHRARRPTPQHVVNVTGFHRLTRVVDSRCGVFFALMTQMRISEAADLLGVSDDTVRRWIESGRLVAGPDEAGPRTVDAASVAAVMVDQAPAAPRRRAPVGAQPLPRHRHPRREGRGDGPGRDPGRTAPDRVADEPRGGRRAGARARVSLPRRASRRRTSSWTSSGEGRRGRRRWPSWPSSRAGCSAGLVHARTTRRSPSRRRRR